MQVLLAHVHAVLGDDHRQPVAPFGRERGQGAEPVGHRVHHVRMHGGMGERTQRVLEQLHRGDRITESGPGGQGTSLAVKPVFSVLARRVRQASRAGLQQDLRPSLPPLVGEQAHRGLARQCRPEVPVLRVAEQFIHHAGEPILRLRGRTQQHIDQLGQQGVVPGPRQPGPPGYRRRTAPHRDRLHGLHVGGELPAHRFVARGDQRDQGEVVLRQASDELVTPNADPAELVRVGAFCCQCHLHIKPRHLDRRSQFRTGQGEPTCHEEPCWGRVPGCASSRLRRLSSRRADRVRFARICS